MALKQFDDNDIPDAIEFLAQWVRRPAAVGAILPSGKSLAHAMARQIDFGRPGLVLDLGGGTGTITKACIEIGVDPRSIVVLEKAPSFCSLIRERFPEVRVIRGDARNQLGAALGEAAGKEGRDAEKLAGKRDIGLTDLGIVGRQRFVHDLRTRAGHFDHGFRQLEQRELVRVADVDRHVMTGLRERDDAAH